MLSNDEIDVNDSPVGEAGGRERERETGFLAPVMMMVVESQGECDSNCAIFPPAVFLFLGCH